MSHNYEDFDKAIIQIRRRLDVIPHEYKKKEDFNPLEHVIEIMKASNSKERKKELISNCKAMDKAMEMIVKARYEGFNKAIKNYTQILNNVTESNQNIQLLQENSEMCTALFSSRSHSVNNLYIQKLEYTYMIEILDKIETLKKLPDKLQEFVSNGQFLEAAQLLVDADHQLNEDDLLKIGALSDKYEDIVGKKNAFHETLLDIIHDIIYLNIDDESSDNNDTNDNRKSKSSLKYSSILMKTKDKSVLINELVSGLFVLNKQRDAFHVITGRIRTDLRSMIQKVIISVKQKASQGSDITSSSSSSSSNSTDPSYLFTMMLNIVFEKCKSILLNHKYVSSLFEEKLTEIELIKNRRTQVVDLNSIGYNYTIDYVWEEIQKELQTLISYYINAPIDNSIKMEDIKEEVTSKRTRLFRFSNSSAFTLYEMSDKHRFHYKNMDLGEPSQYNLSSIYPIISEFCESALKLIDNPKASNRLQKWMNDFISTTFMVNIKSDYKHRVLSIKEGSEAFKIRDKYSKSIYSSDDDKRPLLKIAVEAYKCIKELYQDIISMPHYTNDFHQIIENIMSIFYETMKSKLDELLKDTETGRALRSEEWKEIIVLDSIWKKIEKIYKVDISSNKPNNNTQDIIVTRQTRSGSLQEMQIPNITSSYQEFDDDGYYDLLFNLEHSWYTGSTPSGIPLSKKHMIMDPSKIGLLALIHDSLYWMYYKIYHLDRDEPTQTFKKSSSTVKSQYKDFSRSVKRSLSKDFTTSVVNHPPISQNMLNLIKKYKETSDEALQAIFIDLRLQTCYFLDDIGRSNYVLQVEDRSPDSCCLQLNESLSSIHQTLLSYLPAIKIKYLFSKLPNLMSLLLIQSLKVGITSINRYGVLKMVRNVYALQQNLSNITSFNEAPFDKVRKYYELLNMSVDEILKYISKHVKDTNGFTMQEYRTVLEVVSDPKGRCLSDSLENKLRSLFSI